MKPKANISISYKSIAKYLAGEMRDAELREFEDNVNKLPENKQLINKMKNDWELIERHTPKQVDVDSAWGKVYNKVVADEPAITTYKKPVYNLQWAKWAAAAIVILAVGTSLFFWGAQNREIHIESLANQTTLVHCLPDGSTVYLEAQTSLTYNKNFGKNNRKVTLNGEAFFEVTPSTNLPFQIETNNAVVEVLGTSFSIKSNNTSSFELVVETGSVSISSKSKDRHSLIASAGEKVALIDNQFAKETITQKPEPLWKNKRLQFKDETLTSIIQVVNKNYGSNIILGSANIGNQRITVTFHNNTLPSIVEVISTTLGLEADFTNNTIILSQP